MTIFFEFRAEDVEETYNQQFYTEATVTSNSTSDALDVNCTYTDTVCISPTRTQVDLHPTI